MSEKKRKRSLEKGEKPSKKRNASTPISRKSSHTGDLIDVIQVAERDESGPVVATMPGLSLPSKLQLKAYTKMRKPSSRAHENELLFHSADHLRMDYIAREYSKDAPEKFLKHYIGIFDSQKQELQVVEAKLMSVRASLRSEDQDAQAQMREQQSQNGLSARQQLGMEFGNKRTKKLIQSLTDNAVSPYKGKENMSQEEIMDSVKSDPAASAVLESMAAFAAGAPTKESQQAAAEEAKPRPRHNANATLPVHVYPIEQIVGTEMLSSCKVKPWMDGIAEDTEIKTESRFVSKRLAALAEEANKRLDDDDDEDEEEANEETNDPVAKLKVLKYMLLLMNYFNATRPIGKHGGRKIPDREVLRKHMEVEDHVIGVVRRRFSGDRDMTKWHVDSILTHLAALSLIADEFTTDIHDLQHDLNLTNREMSKYFREAGAKVTPVTDAQREKNHWSKQQATDHKIAKLKIPLEFPKPKRAPATGRR